MSYEEMINKDLIWVLLSVRYKIIKDVPLYAHIKATTWALPKSLVDFNRNTTISSLNDDLYIIGEAKWIILNAKTRKIIPAKHVDYLIPTCDEKLFDTPLLIKMFTYVKLNFVILIIMGIRIMLGML